MTIYIRNRFVRGLVILVSAQVLFVLTLGLRTLGLGLTKIFRLWGDFGSMYLGFKRLKYRDLRFHTMMLNVVIAIIVHTYSNLFSFLLARVSFNSTTNSLEDDFRRYIRETRTMRMTRAVRMKGTRTITPELEE